MTDRKELVERLRGDPDFFPWPERLLNEAADEIERLSAALSEQEKPVGYLLKGEFYKSEDAAKEASRFMYDCEATPIPLYTHPSPTGPVAGLREAAQAVCDFAWSAVSADCDESREYLNKLVNDLRAALAPPHTEAEQERGSAAAEAPDYFGSLVERARISAAKASAKFPQPNYVALKIAEEAGEVVRGAVHYAENRMEWEEVEGEIVQLLAMILRFVTEGGQINGITPPILPAPEVVPHG